MWRWRRRFDLSSLEGSLPTSIIQVRGDEAVARGAVVYPETLLVIVAAPKTNLYSGRGID